MSEHLSRIKQDTFVGMGFSNLVALCIVVATAVTLNEHGITNIQTSAQAAEALRPVAGEFAFLVFALGIIGTGLLAVPVLAGSAAYAVSELFGWKAGLSRGFHEARGFYLIIIAATGIGSAMGFFDVDPIKALVAERDRQRRDLGADHGRADADRPVEAVMGNFTISPRHRFFGWAATGHGRGRRGDVRDDLLALLARAIGVTVAALARRALLACECRDVGERDRALLVLVDRVEVLVDHGHAGLGFLPGQAAVAVLVGGGEALLHLRAHVLGAVGVLRRRARRHRDERDGEGDAASDRSSVGHG